MRGYMFRNRWFALLFVGLVLAAVTRIVGTGNGDGVLDEATNQIVNQQDRAERLSVTAATDDAGADVSVQFTSDEELIDPATGEDPAPIDEFAAEQATEVVPESEVVIVSQDVGGEAQPHEF